LLAIKDEFQHGVMQSNYINLIIHHHHRSGVLCNFSQLAIAPFFLVCSMNFNLRSLLSTPNALLSLVRNASKKTGGSTRNPSNPHGR